ncbi:MAG TPA: methionine--tRNA ligase subunit beta [Candidatus Pacearchaeota archaeon]|nr:methionine--tRNA ligase subunit beta [Candidatus Pacearchaeota archaeon]
MDNISFEDFKKLDLRIAKILSVEAVEGATRLLKLEVDLGEEKRIVVSGVAEYYTENNLIGKEVIIISNLEPKIIFGIKSHGMILFAKQGDMPIILKPEEEVTPGAIIS